MSDEQQPQQAAVPAWWCSPADQQQQQQQPQTQPQQQPQPTPVFGDLFGGGQQQQQQQQPMQFVPLAHQASQPSPQPATQGQVQLVQLAPQQYQQQQQQQQQQTFVYPAQQQQQPQFVQLPPGMVLVQHNGQTFATYAAPHQQQPQFVAASAPPTYGQQQQQQQQPLPYHQHPHHPAHDLGSASGGKNNGANAPRKSAGGRGRKELVVPPPAPGDTEPGPRQLIVNYIAVDMTSEELRELFEPFGDVEVARVVDEPNAGHNRGFGFVYFRSCVDAAASIEGLSGRVLRGKRLRVSYAIPQRPIASEKQQPPQSTAPHSSVAADTLTKPAAVSPTHDETGDGREDHESISPV